MTGASAIVLNGETREWTTPKSVAALLAELGIDTRTVAVERNRAVVRRAHYAETTILPGDEVEIVSFVGGG